MPERRWVVDDDGTVWFATTAGGYWEPWEALDQSNPDFEAAYIGLAELIESAAQPQPLFEGTVGELDRWASLSPDGLRLDDRIAVYAAERADA
jgi:hypothetical protein